MRDEIHDLLQAAQASLFLGMKLSKQGSYARRAPSTDSLPHFERAHEILERILTELPNHRQALVMMSQVSECLLDYDTALRLLSHALDVGEPRSKKLLKRLALLREYSKIWRDLGLSPEMLRELGEYLEAQGVDPNHTTLRLTRDWLVENHIDDPEVVIDALRRRGAFSDFLVFSNVVYG